MNSAVLLGVTVVVLVYFVITRFLKKGISSGGVSLKEILSNGALLVDVRSAGEFSQGHIKGAINIAYDTIANNLGRLPKGKDIVLYCASGARSSAAMATLRSNGYERVYNAGSIGALRKALGQAG